ncbi:XrtA/PEP-CTERM system TPR-repeat protein PrsT [Neptunomonas antarctica]|uniref:Putative PEP-CTERM system TPR-repeat lipoprotein n=1 Tax=Neptunomonas antarctica TaxID=619304 RepID=A0A1N7LMV6_9GAMM|nr:XrtA/PEP-CTERM system TPR-repeat protein PrsT [Neptunomonas antarctica]SIS75168.1 putative PEP-CTERM system TPR-repeat lipoprotein [Neptunomonas antarctica]
MKLVVAVLLFALLYPAAAFSGEDARFDEAVTYLNENEVQSAVILLKNILQENPDNLKARNLLAYVYMKTGQFISAAKEYGHVVRLSPGSNEALLMQAEMYQLYGDYASVLKLLDPELIFEPKQKAEAHAILGLTYMGLKNEKKAEAEFVLAIDSAESPRAYAGYATLAMFRRDYVNAHEYVDIAIKSSSGDVGLTTKANIFLSEGDYAKALVTYEQAEQKRGPTYNINLGKTEALYHLGRYEDADKYIDQYIEIQKYDVRANYLKAVIALASGDFSAAKEATDRSLATGIFHYPTYLAAGYANYLDQNLNQAERYLSIFLSQNLGADTNKVERLLANIYFELGQPESAVSLIEKLTSRENYKTAVAVAFGEDAREKFDQDIQLLDRQTLDRLQTKLAIGKFLLGDADAAIRELTQALPNAELKEPILTLLVLSYLQANNSKYALEAIDAYIEENESAYVYFLKAEVLRSQFKLKEAGEAFDKSLAAEPDYVSALIGKSKVALGQGKIVEAKELLNRAKQQDPSNPATYIQLAEIAKMRREYVALKDIIEEAASLTQKEPEIVVMLTNYYLAMNQVDTAMKVIQAPYEAMRDNPMLVSSFARTMIAAGQYEQGLPLLERLVQANIGRSDHTVLLAETLAKLGHADTALLKLDSVLVNHPDHTFAIYKKVDVLLESGQIEKARSFSHSLSLNPQTEDLSYRVTGDIEFHQGNWAEAVRNYKRILTSISDPAQVRKLVQAMNLLGETEELEGILRDYVRNYPQDLSWRNELAILLMQQLRYEEAQKHYLVILESNPSNAKVLNNLSWIYSQDKKTLRKAREMSSLAVKFAPSSAPILDTYGWILYLSGDLDESLVYVEKAWQENPENPTMGYHYAVLLHATGKSTRSKELLVELVDSEYDFLEKSDAVALYKSL